MSAPPSPESPTWPPLAASYQAIGAAVEHLAPFLSPHLARILALLTPTTLPEHVPPSVTASKEAALLLVGKHVQLRHVLKPAREVWRAGEVDAEGAGQLLSVVEAAVERVEASEAGGMAKVVSGVMQRLSGMEWGAWFCTVPCVWWWYIDVCELHGRFAHGYL